MENQIPNNKEELPLAHYHELYAALDPADVEARCGAELSNGAFRFTFLGHTMTAAFPEFSLAAEPASRALKSAAAQILLLRYLISGKASPWLGKMMSYRELPWGSVYDANFNGRCRIRLARTFGQNLGGFRAAAEKLGGSAASFGDAAADFPLFCGITVRVILNEGDDEFPATSQFLFSDNISSVWNAEDLAVLCEVIITALKEVS